MSRCNGVKKDGQQCSYNGKFLADGKAYCGIHLPGETLPVELVNAPPATARPSRDTSEDVSPARSSDAISFYSSLSDKTYYAFSNFYPAITCWRKLIGATTEHLFQAAKFHYTTGDADLDVALLTYRDAILAAPFAMLAKRMGRCRDLPIRPDWESRKVSLMKEIVECKVKQHPEIQALLLSTGDMKLEEKSPRDFFWGVGHSGTGKNELGKVLMQIRDEIA